MSEDYAQADAAESAKVLAVVKDLGEHFDAVVILCTRHDGARGTRTVAKGAGNWHAQYGIIREWLVNRDEDTRVAARREHDES